MSRLILASASPRRQELLKLISDSFRVIAPQVEEEIAPGTEPGRAVAELALRKAEAVAATYPAHAVIGADTVVSLDGRILGKPRSEGEAVEMLEALSGKEHSVYTGVAVCCPVVGRDGRFAFVERTDVRFAPLGREEILRYVHTGEPMDKAGAYGIQGKAALFISGIHGDYSNVVGLPVPRLYQELRRLFAHPNDWGQWIGAAKS